MTKLEALKKYWGYDSFRPLQEAVVDRVLDHADTLALMPTGGGKSLCYQLPAVIMEGVCLVVSPLIALMKDQVENLKRRHIKSACITSGMTSGEAEVVLSNCLYGDVKLLYVSPERLHNRLFVAYFKRMKISFVAVDEAHCISQWGYEFRPSYLQVASVRQHHPEVAILAITATATPEVAVDICQLLQLRSPQTLASSFERKNLAYMVIRDPDRSTRLVRILAAVKGAAIIYVRSRRRAELVAAQLATQGIRATYYHAGLSAHERDQRQAVWMNSTDGVMVATNAFGMGIDRADVRAVVHLDPPLSLEAYFQEAGRAGRDGKKAYAVFLTSDGDASRIDSAIETSYPPINYIRNVYRAVCNFYNVPIGSGADTSFDFDLQSLCNTYGFEPTTCYSALHLLETEGMLAIPDRNDPVSQLHLVTNRNETYRYQVDHVREGNLLQIVMRLYPGISSEYVPISERAIGKECYTDADTVSALLSQMAQHGVVAYRPATNKPQICFTANRVDANALYLTDSNYRQLKQAATSRAQAVKDYIGQHNRCRSQLLLTYFGQAESEPCGQCDVCLAANRRPDPASLLPALRLQLAASPRTVKALQAAVSPLEPDAVAQAVRQLIDSGEATIDPDFNIRLL
ncbi:MAG: RecQ family ATP-dependent DNA helicase [Bacteroidales bacterium]|nr:RecQ family ATP-dependent DNA helicase [Bacteroidales bacterium]